MNCDMYLIYGTLVYFGWGFFKVITFDGGWSFSSPYQFLSGLTQCSSNLYFALNSIQAFPATCPSQDMSCVLKIAHLLVHFLEMIHLQLIDDLSSLWSVDDFFH